jgi:tetratricopeptide (TPR) repeat protein
MPRFPTAALLAAFLGASAPAIARHAHDAEPERLGTVLFDNSCAPAVQGDFNRAVALLHSFEFGRAINGFETVLADDAGCAIAHWGIALGYWGNPFGAMRSSAALVSGLASIDEARSLDAGTVRERAFIDAAARLFENHAEVSQRDRIVAYERAMERVARNHPDDSEAAIFYALAVNQAALPTDKTYAPQLKAAGILEPLVARYPDHPGLTHYIIHAYDHPPLAAKALDAARRYAEIAPSAPHALHMPSHTFTRVGSWQESADTNRRSEQVAVEQDVMTEALHAMDYQVYAYLQMAEDDDAKAVLDRLPRVAARFSANAIGGAAPPMAGFFAMTAIPARYALERGAWAEAARSPVPANGTPFTIAMAHFARALGAARSGNPEAAHGDLARLSALRGQLAADDNTYWAEQVNIQHQVARAWVGFAAGSRKEGIATLRAAADAEDATDKSAVTPGPLAPARELLGYMLLEADDPARALVEFERSMAKEPRRFRGAYGAALAADAAGDRDKARRYFAEVVAIAGATASPRPELRRARSYVAAGG